MAKLLIIESCTRRSTHLASTFYCIESLHFWEIFCGYNYIAEMRALPYPVPDFLRLGMERKKKEKNALNVYIVRFFLFTRVVFFTLFFCLCDTFRFPSKKKKSFFFVMCSTIRYRNANKTCYSILIISQHLF